MWGSEELNLLGWFFKIYIKARNINKADIKIANLDDHLNYGRLTVKELFYLSDFLNLDLELLRRTIDIRFIDESNNKDFLGYKFQRMPKKQQDKAQDEILQMFKTILEIEKKDKKYIIGELIGKFERGYLLDGLFNYVFGEDDNQYEIYVNKGFNRSEKLSGCFSIINDSQKKKLDFNRFIKCFVDKYLGENEERAIMLNEIVKDYQKVNLEDMLKVIIKPSVGRAARIYIYSRALYFNDLGEKTYNKTDYQTALKCFNTALKIYDNDEFFKYAPSPFCRCRHEIKSNEEIIDKNIILFNRARTLNEIGEKEKALVDLKLIIESDSYKEYTIEEKIQIDSLFDDISEKH